MTSSARQTAESAYTKTCIDPISSLYGHYRDPPNRLYRNTLLVHAPLPPEPERSAQ